MSRWQRVARRLEEGSLYALLFCLPYSIAIVEISFGLLLLGWLMERLHPVTRWQTLWVSRALRPLALAVGVYLAICALSIAVSGFPSLSLNGFVNKWLEYLLLFVIVTDLCCRPGVISRCLALLACSALTVVIYGVAQEMGFSGWYTLEAVSLYRRMTGPYRNPSDLATYLMVLIPILMGWSLCLRGAKRASLWGLLLFLIACLARTEAFGAWIGLWVGLAVIVLSMPAMRRAGMGLLIGSILIVACVLHYTGHAKRTVSLSDLGTADRLVMWQAALGMIQDRPLLGHGINTFMANYLSYWVGGERQPRYAHNCYLQIAAETGLMGLASFVALLAGLFARLVAGMRARHSPEALLLSGFVAGLLAFAVQAGVDTNFYSLRQATLFWALSGVALGLAMAMRADGQACGGIGR